MRRYVIVDVEAKTVELVEAKDYEAALKMAGLDSGGVDWQSLGKDADGGRHFTLWAYEFGLMELGKRKYCRIGRQMFAGNLMISASDLMGEENSMRKREADLLADKIEWFENEGECEAAFAVGKMDRPCTTINGVKVWEWNVG